MEYTEIMRVTDIQNTPMTDWIADGASVLISGSGGGLLEADGIMQRIEQSFLDTGHPRDLTVVHGLGISNGTDSGLQRFAHEGMIRRVIGGHWSWGPTLQKMCFENKIQAYTFPAGMLITLMREVGAGRPGVITKTGLGTFADPDFGGGKCNEITDDDLVEKITVDGEQYLRYKPLKIDVAIIRGTYMDAQGNITNKHEPADLDVYPCALAAYNSGGVVLAQVAKQGDSPIVPARLVSVPGVLIHGYLQVDAPQCAISHYNPAISGEVEQDDNDSAALALPQGMRGVIARRAADEIGDAWSVNFGFGIPGGIPAILSDRRIEYWGTLEQGIHRGNMLDGAVFGAALYPAAIMSSTQQFDFYSGGGLDCAFLGMGEMDKHGNVNVSKLGDYIVGPGGFIDIVQGAKKIVFCGTFEAKGLKTSFDENDAICIDSHGQIPKLVDTVKHVTFSGKNAIAQQKQVIYVTERAVFELRPAGVTLIEVRQGADIHRDVLQRMQFTPIVDIAGD